MSRTRRHGRLAPFFVTWTWVRMRRPPTST